MLVKLMLATCLGVMLIAVGLTGLFLNTQVRINEVEDEIALHRDQIANSKRDLREIKERAAQASDHIIITHEYADKDAPNYGGF